jgi:hypothetical protein
LAAADGNLSAEERKQKVRAIGSEAGVKLVELLGQKAARGINRHLTVVLQVTEANIK